MTSSNSKRQVVEPFAKNSDPLPLLIDHLLQAKRYAKAGNFGLIGKLVDLAVDEAKEQVFLNKLGQELSQNDT